MDFDIADESSAIDDTFHLLLQPPPSEVIEAHQPETQSWAQGPRSGRWTVSTGNNKSAIDDRVHDLLGIPAPSEHGSTAKVKKIDGALLQKLAIANEAERKTKQQASQEAAAKAAQESAKQAKVKMDEPKGFYVPQLQDGRGIRIRSRDGKSEIIKDPAPKATATAEAAQIKAPLAHNNKASSPLASVKNAGAASQASKRSNRVRIVGKNGEEYFVELPFFSSGSKKGSVSQTQKTTPQANGTKPDPAAKPGAAAAILKDAEVKAKRSDVAENEAKRLRDERIAADAKRVSDDQAAAEAKRRRDETVAAKAKREQNAKAALEAKLGGEEKAESEFIMHGALPMSPVASVAKSASGSKSSSKISEKQHPGVFDGPSKPASAASSITSVQKAASIQQQYPTQDERNQGSNRGSKRSESVGWHEMGFGTYEPAMSNRSKLGQGQGTPVPNQKQHTPQSRSPARGSQQNAPSVVYQAHKSPSNPAGFERSYHKPSPQQQWAGIPRQSPIQAAQWDQGWGSKPAASAPDNFPIHFPSPSNLSYRNGRQQPGGGFPGQAEGPTVFAGRGWISPHPLSVAPTWERDPPEPIIRLPAGAAARTESGVATMTYDEWLAVQNQPDNLRGSQAARSRVHTIMSSPRQRSDGRNVGGDMNDQRRNISRTSSHASRQYGGGSWGYRGGGPGRPDNYRTPTVKTESDVVDHRPDAFLEPQVEPNFVAGQVRNEYRQVKTQLKMPWDEQKRWNENAPDIGDCCF